MNDLIHNTTNNTTTNKRQQTCVLPRPPIPPSPPPIKVGVRAVVLTVTTTTTKKCCCCCCCFHGCCFSLDVCCFLLDVCFVVSFKLNGKEGLGSCDCEDEESRVRKPILSCCRVLVETSALPAFRKSGSIGRGPELAPSTYSTTCTHRQTP